MHGIGLKFGLALGLGLEHRLHMRISYDSLRTEDCLRSTLAGHFQSREIKKCATRRLLLIIFRLINVQDNNSGWGTEGSEGR